jgi:hypothetical protein
MKNIHIIPTDKPSRVYKHLGRELKHTIRYFEQKGLLCINQHIYITSDEEIKEGDWFYDLDTKYVKVNQSWKNSNLDLNGKKIILTTDPDLIKDGVQAIDDEFLQWFVKNPSCENVKVFYDLFEFEKDSSRKQYKIIILQEEPKQETIEEVAKIWVNNRFTKQICGDESYPDIHASKEGIVESHIIFAKWQAERMYGEEEVLKLLYELHLIHNSDSDMTFMKVDEWFEQYKKK